MEPGRCQPLHKRWRTLVQTQGERPAVYLPGNGGVLTFGDLEAAVSEMPRAAEMQVADGKGLLFLQQVLRAWRDDAVLVPVEAGGAGCNWDRPVPGRICHVKMTSGSTGSARGVYFTAGQLMADADQIMRTMGLAPERPNLAVISMAHSYGFSNLVLPLLLHGIPMVLAENPLPESVRAALATGEAFTVPAVPAMWRAWDAAGVIDGRMQLGISAGAPLPLDLEQRVFENRGLKLHNFYGSSECGGIAYDRSSVPRVDAQIAGRAMEGVKLSIDPGTGCLKVQSPAVGSGYADGGEALSGGIFLTSDVVRLDGDEVWLEGRASDAINVAGRKIAPSAVEEKLLKLPGVRHCVVFGIPSPDPVRVEEMVACINLSGDAGMEAVRLAALRLLPPGEQPRHWCACGDLEPDARGKISRARWREWFLGKNAV